VAGQMNAKFVTLCTLAVGAIYATGYAITAEGHAQGSPFSQQSPSAAGSAAGTGAVATASSGTSKVASSATKKGGESTQGNSKTSQSGTGSSSGSGSSSTSPSKSSTSSSASGNKSSSSQSTAKYIDGTYTGSAANRIGAVSVAVAIKGGKIGSVQITSCNTHYPQSYIDPVLPDYVISHQSTSIPVVSGATLSTADFYYAVTQALAKAQNPSYKG